MLLPEEPAPEKRLFVSTALINSGASLCVPGYGSFLAVSSMGFENPKPALSGIAAGFFAEMMQLAAVPASSGEHHWRSLVPWTDGGGRTRAEKRLQICLWSTIPCTWAATYFDQLAVQYEHARVLPPGFENADASAAVWSAIIPGGGLFYKGYRSSGWGFYAAEMAAASVAAHYGWSDGGRRALCVLGAVKCAEIAIAWFVRPSYAFYSREYERENRATLDISFAPEGKELSPRLAATMHF